MEVSKIIQTLASYIRGTPQRSYDEEVAIEYVNKSYIQTLPTYVVMPVYEPLHEIIIEK